MTDENSKGMLVAPSVLVDRWIEDPDLALAAANSGGDAVGKWVEHAAETLKPQPQLAPGTVCIAILSARGDILWRTDDFPIDEIAHLLTSSAIGRILRSQEPDITPILSNRGGPIVSVIAPIPATRDWSLSPCCRTAASAKNAAAIAFVVRLAGGRSAIAATARSFGLTGMETRIVTALVEHGDLRRAAAATGIAYSTARTSLHMVFQKTKQLRQAGVVSLFARAAAGVTSEGQADNACLVDHFGLRKRDSDLVFLLSEGLTRSSAARVLGISSATAKQDLKRIFLQLGVKSATEAARAAVEARAAQLLAAATNGELTFGTDRHDPLRLLPRRENGFIAISDYGPSDGDPVLILHTSGTTRHPSRNLVRALQDQGFRPITIDRPGFGLTDLIERDDCPFVDAADDMAEALDRMKICKTHVMARGGPYVALAFARKHATRLGRVILINPISDHAASRSTGGLLGASISFLLMHPDRISALARLAGHYATPKRAMTVLRSALGANSSDLSAIEAEGELDDYLQSIAHFAAGRISGFVREHRALASGVAAAPLKTAENWTVFTGTLDPLRSAEIARSVWRDFLPGATFHTLAGAGRFAHISARNDIVRALALGR